jgi:hypothetical protein
MTRHLTGIELQINKMTHKKNFNSPFSKETFLEFLESSFVQWFREKVSDVIFAWDLANLDSASGDLLHDEHSYFVQMSSSRRTFQSF